MEHSRTVKTVHHICCGEITNAALSVVTKASFFAFCAVMHPNECACHLALLSIICFPRPYAPDTNDSGRRALTSWTALQPRPHIVLVGKHPSLHDAADQHCCVRVEPRYDAVGSGIATFSGLLALAAGASTRYVLVTNGDIIILQDIYNVIRRADRRFMAWLLVAARWDVSRVLVFFACAADHGCACAYMHCQFRVASLMSSLVSAHCPANDVLRHAKSFAAQLRTCRCPRARCRKPSTGQMQMCSAPPNGNCWCESWSTACVCCVLM